MNMDPGTVFTMLNFLLNLQNTKRSNKLVFHYTRLERLARDKHLLFKNKIKHCEYGPKGRINKTSFYLKLTNGSNKLDKMKFC